jgi:hypothetical protein
VSGTEHKEPTANEWKIARAIHEELTETFPGFDRQMLFIIKSIVIANMIKHRERTGS